MKVWVKTLVCKACNLMGAKSTYCDECATECCHHSVYRMELFPDQGYKLVWVCIECLKDIEVTDDR